MMADSLVGKRILPGYEDFYKQHFADSDSAADTDSSSDDDEEDFGQEPEVHVNWKEGSVEPKLPQFTGEPGVKLQFPQTPSYLDVFNLFFGEDLVESIVQETNRYAAQMLARNAEHVAAHPCSRLATWTLVTVNEMYSFLGVTLAMALTRKREIQEYWTNHEVTDTPYIRSQMTRNRYCAISRNLHFNDNSNMLPREDLRYDPLFKVRPVMDHLTNSFRAVYKPSQDIAINEGVLGGRANLAARVVDPFKPTNGMRVFMVCEASTGYCCSFEVYYGYTAKPVGQKSYAPVFRVMRQAELLGKGYCLFTDQYYSTPELALALAEEQTSSVGVVRPTQRGMPESFCDGDVPRGGLQVLHDATDTLNVLKWRDVYMLSTVDRPVLADPGGRRGRGANHWKPSTLLLYNRGKAAFDTNDQVCSYFLLERRGMLWYKRLFWRLVNMCVINAHIVYRQVVGPVSHLEFQRELVSQLALRAHVQPTTPLPPGTDVRRLQPGNHFPELVPPTGKVARPARSCHVCSSFHRRETRYRCEECKTPLCLTPCFKLYHRNKNFKQAWLNGKA